MGHLIRNGEALLAAFALLGGLSLLVRKTYRFMRKANRLIDRFVGDEDNPGLLDSVKTLEAGQKKMMHELFPNGGGSLRDAVDRHTIALDEVKGLAIDARERAAEAVDEAAKLAAALGRTDAVARAERERQQQSLDRVLDAFLDDRRETQHRVQAYVMALQELGIDLTHVTEALDENPWDGGERRGQS